jgi:hypothetical protein
MKKDIFEQLIYSESANLIEWEPALSSWMRYTFRLENGLNVRVTIDSPFCYNECDLLNLIHKDVIHVMDLILW